MLRVTKDATFLALSLGCLSGFSKRKDLVFIIQLNVEKKVQSHFLALGWAIPFIVGRFFFPSRASVCGVCAARRAVS